ncbi:hypothetical protein KFL_000620070 [Klebsormidium nitens]|uniref:C2H2-type domain-containing protein n=1 Tax=Klebsormidium nitens TaxID=105231 RepID=A0A1Y1HRQ7_KLENI|nr:hypothetical protein KFL_000620070 [Klebsormidium nitens]|eukprot:GAQ80773.1 hypothetical protein KFL_000620070 [Klebsormidium nitens]
MRASFKFKLSLEVKDKHRSCTVEERPKNRGFEGGHTSSGQACKDVKQEMLQHPQALVSGALSVPGTEQPYQPSKSSLESVQETMSLFEEALLKLQRDSGSLMFGGQHGGTGPTVPVLRDLQPQPQSHAGSRLAEKGPSKQFYFESVSQEPEVPGRTNRFFPYVAVRGSGADPSEAMRGFGVSQGLATPLSTQIDIRGRGESQRQKFGKEDGIEEQHQLKEAPPDRNVSAEEKTSDLGEVPKRQEKAAGDALCYRLHVPTNGSGSDWDTKDSSSPHWGTSEDWQAKSGGLSVGGKEDKRALEGFASFHLEDSERTEKKRTPSGSGSESDGARRSGSKSGGEHCKEHADSMSPDKASVGVPQRNKGGYLGADDDGGKGSNESTVQSGQKRKHTGSDSSESVRKGEARASEAERPRNEKKSSGEEKPTGNLRGGARDGKEDHHLGGWKTIADGHQTVYECRFCGKRFLVSQALGGHMNRHRAERENEKAKVQAKAAREAAAFYESQQQTPKLHGTSIRSPSTPLNLTETSYGIPLSVTSNPSVAPMPAAALLLPGTKPDFLGAGGPPQQGNTSPITQYEAGFEAGFGAGLVALARAGLLVPDAMMALGWQGMGAGSRGGGNDVALQEAFEQPPLGADSGRGPPGETMQGRATPGPSNVGSEPLDARVKPDQEEKSGRGGPQNLPPAVMPVWIDTARGQQQVFQVEGVQGIDKGLYALKPVGATTSPDLSLGPSSDNFGFPGGGPARQNDPPEPFEYGQPTAPKSGPRGFRVGEFGPTQKLQSLGPQERPRLAGNVARVAHPLVTRGVMATAIRPGLGTVERYGLAGFRAGQPNCLPVTLGARSSPQRYGVGSSNSGRPDSAGNGIGLGMGPKPSLLNLSGDRPDSTGPGRSSADFVSSPPLLRTLSLSREPLDLYQDFLHSQPSGLGSQLGDANLGGGFDDQLSSFAQEHPDWPDYFQGGSVNSGDAYGAPGEKGSS